MANTKVTTGVIKDDAVGADQLASNSVVTASIVDNAITTAKINNDAILTAKISNSAVTNAKLAANSVDSDQYVDGSIDTAHIADGQITSAKLDTNISISGELTVGSHLNMGDGDILKMGAGDDLQIYHDGSHSYIDELVTGDLRIRSNSAVALLKSSDNANMLVAIPDGAVTLYYAGSPKIATTSSGIDVTGTVVADGLTVDGNATISTAGSTVLDVEATGANDSRVRITAGNTSKSYVEFADPDDVDTGEIRYDHNTNSMQFRVNGNQEAITIDSNKNVGIGTDNPAYTLDVNSGTTNDTVRFKSSDDTVSIVLEDDDTLNEIESSATGIRFDLSGSERLRVSSSGNVTINSSGTIPTGVLLGRQLVVGSSTGSEVIAFREDTSVAVGDKVGAFLIGNSDTDGAEDHFVGMWGKVSSTNGSQDLHFAAGRSGYEGDSPQMTLDSSGQVGIGVNPSEALHIEYNTVSGGDNYIHMRKTDQGAGQGVFIGIPTASNNLRIMNHANNSITFHTTTSDTERMRIQGDTGNVGIGVQNCVSHLSIGNPSADGVVDYTKGITFVDTLSSPTNAWVHAAIVTTGSSGFNGNLIFATDGDGNQDNDTSGLTERMRIDSSGILIVNNGGNSTGGIVNKHRSAITVGTTATNISNAATYGGLAFVWVNSGGNIAHDLVSYSLSQVDVLASQNISGGPAGRTYSAASGILKVAMASGSYSVYATEIRASTG